MRLDSALYDLLIEASLETLGSGVVEPTITHDSCFDIAHLVCILTGALVLSVSSPEAPVRLGSAPLVHSCRISGIPVEVHPQ